MKDRKYVLLLADIHANETALLAARRDAQRRYRHVHDFRVWFLGDLFGRGPFPAETWYTLQRYNVEAAVVGNHDLGVIDRDKNIKVNGRWQGHFNNLDWNLLLNHRRELAQSLLLDVENTTDAVLGGAVYQFLSTLPLVYEPLPGIFMIHGGLEREFKPNLQYHLPFLTWDYVRNSLDAQRTIQFATWLHQAQVTAPVLKPYRKYFDSPHLILLGHWHRRRLYFGHNNTWEDPVRLDYAYTIPTGRQQPIVAAPGSVGFPTEIDDRDASYAVLEFEEERVCSITFHKTEYDRYAVSRRMRDKKYPGEIIKRLYLTGESAPFEKYW